MFYLFCHSGGAQNFVLISVIQQRENVSKKFDLEAVRLQKEQSEAL